MNRKITNSLSMQDFNGDRSKPVTELFKEQVLKHPDTTAVLFEDKNISYAELDTLADQIARTLLSLALDRESRVGICLDRSHYAIAAMLGILRAGLAFVPLDPDFPPSRLQYMIDDSAIKCCLTELSYSPTITPLVENIYLIESDFDQPVLPFDPTSVVLEPDQLAYVMYTSGSTGNPKGVQIEHGALSNYCLADALAYELTEDDITLQFSTLNFDIAIEEIFPPLITGSTIAVRPQQRSDELNELSGLIDRYKVSAIHVATAYWHEWVNLLAATGTSTPESIRLMVVTGEKVSSEHYRTWLRHTHHQVLWANAYGPTETTVTATVFIPPDHWTGDNLPIGKALQGYTTRILDSELNEVRSGDTGELYIGGYSLARGYLNRPDLTAHSFVISGNGERLYKTGDLARYLKSGDIEYAGRIDHQIKIGSYRIEPGEIEEAINKHPDVYESLVLASEDTSGNNRQIIAYLGCNASLSVHEVHRYLTDQLPPFMLPAGYLQLDSLPKTINGKIDRDALPSTDTAIHPASEDFVAAKSETEQILVAIWAKVLRRRSLGVTDNFFDLGGTSLLVTRCILNMHETIGTSPTAREFYATPTIAEISRLLDNPDNSESILLNQVVPDSELELTNSQYQIWFQQKLHPTLSIYNIYEAFDIDGQLDTERLRAVVDELVTRYPILRMSFTEKDGRCYQQYESQSSKRPVLETIKDKSVSPDAWTQEEVHRKFDLTQSEVCRFKLLEFAEGRHRLVITVHHIISDGWSMTLLIRELGARYNGSFSSNQSTQHVDFRQYVNYSHSLKQSPSHQEQLDYWKKQLATVSPQELPQAGKSVGERRYTADFVSFDLEIPAQQIKSVCDNFAVTPFMFLLGAFKALLYRYSSVDEVTVAVAHSGRSWPEVEETFGLFVNTLITKTGITERDTTAQLLTQVRRSSLDAFANQDISLAELVTILRPNRQQQSMPFTPFLFLMQDIPDTDLILNDLHTTPCLSAPENVDYDLLLEITEHADRADRPYSARLVFAEELYERDSMLRLTEHYQKITQAMLERRTTPITNLDILDTKEKHFVLDAVNQTQLSYPKDSSLCVEIWKNADKTPDKPAVCFESDTLTYNELRNRVELLAGHLSQHNVHANTLIGVFLERGIEMLVAMLAIQQAGAAYLPMDPLYPKERIEYIIDDAQAPLLITETSLEDSVPSIEATIICMDRDWPSISQSIPLRTPTAAKPTDLAYVIYTSGSTGKPKGVQLTRRNVLNFLFAMKERPGLAPSDKLTAVTTISFDIAVLELYLPLICGACVDIVSRETATNGHALAGRLSETSSSVMQATPATWRLLLETDWQNPPGFKALIGGEALPQELIAPLLAHSDQLWNMYGPTETTVWSTCALIVSDEQAPSIGTPIGNTQIYVLSEQLQPTPIDVPGELCIGGDGVAKGYLNRPELTADKFVANEFTHTGQIYRTGDSARWLPDGSLEFLGRLDNQIKLRGYRIEPGEIEKSICEIEGIEQAVVLVYTLPEGEMLTAYLISTLPIDEQQIRKYLANSLPDYMIPSLWVQVESIPLTPNGKIDRKALPAPEQVKSAHRSTSQPVTKTEKSVAALWSQLLPGSVPGRDDNFFGLGGHSLLAMRFIARAEEKFGYTIPIRSLMSDTLADIALQISPDDLPLINDKSVALDIVEFGFTRQPDRSLFTALHRPSEPMRDSGNAGRAVLICQPIGHEYLRMHKCVQRLACELAKTGHTVLRFDYSGTGDSEGDFHHSRLEFWQEDVQRASEILKSETDCQKISTIGIRLGAPIMMSAQLPDVDRTILWDPVVSGSRWIAQQQSLHRNELKNLDRYRWVQRKSRDYEIVGYQYTLDLIKDINHLELGTHAHRFDDTTQVISSTKCQIDTFLSKDFPHSLASQNLSVIDDGQRWETDESVDDMVLGYLGIQKICDRLN